MTPLDHLRLWFVGLDSDLQYEIAFALVPALVDAFKGQRFRSERDFIKALEAWLAPSRFTPRDRQGRERDSPHRPRVWRGGRAGGQDRVGADQG